MASQKKILDCVILENRSLNDSYFLIRLQLPEEGRDCSFRAGNFVQVHANTPGAFLRRPISICSWNSDFNQIELLIQSVGTVTSHLQTLSPSHRISLVAPLGNSYDTSFSFSGDRPLLIAGGVGVAPILMLSKEMQKQGISPTILIGARTASLIVLQDQFPSTENLYITTDDGALGHKGNVLMHPILSSESASFTSIYTCGPRKMMQAIASFAQEKRIPMQLSLENHMPCGIGVCLCCVEDTKERGNVRTCVDGPVFNIEDLKW